MAKSTLLPSHRLLLLSSRLYSLLLYVYPPHFRGEYGSHMAQVFRDCCRDAYQQSKTFGLLCLWVSALADLIVTALDEEKGHEDAIYRIVATRAAKRGHT